MSSLHIVCAVFAAVICVASPALAQVREVRLEFVAVNADPEALSDPANDKIEIQIDGVAQKEPNYVIAFNDEIGEAEKSLTFVAADSSGRRLLGPTRMNVPFSPKIAQRRISVPVGNLPTMT